MITSNLKAREGFWVDAILTNGFFIIFPSDIYTLEGKDLHMLFDIRDRTVTTTRDTISFPTLGRTIKFHEFVQQDRPTRNHAK